MRMLSIIILLLFTAGNALAEDILLARSPNPFEVTIEVARKSLEAHGYTVSHIQRCDGGLKDFGYQTDPYRTLFIGKPDEVRKLTRRHPEIIPFLPLKLAIYAEDGETLAAIINPMILAPMFNKKELDIQFARWKSDFDSILEDISKQ